MGLEQNNEQHYRQVVDKYHDPAASYAMTTRDYVLRPTVDATPIVITLPLVAEAKGRFYTIKARGSVTFANTITIQDQDESEDWTGDIVMSDSGGNIILYSDGLKWYHNGSASAATDGSHIFINTLWGTGFNEAAILKAADHSGNPLLIGDQTASMCVNRENITFAITGGNYFMGTYNSYATSATMPADFIIGLYIKLDCAHIAYENYVIRGRLVVSVAQTGGTANQFLGVYGAVEFASGAHAVTATSLSAGVKGEASLAGGSLDGPLVGGFFGCAPVVSVSGGSAAIYAWQQQFCDYGLHIHTYTSEGVAAINIRTSDAAKLHDAIRLEASAVGGASRINHVFNFVAADETDGASVSTTTITDADSAEGVIKIVAAGTNYYIPFYDASVIDTEWADIDV